MSSEMEVYGDPLNYSACIKADDELWFDGIAEERWVGLVCVCPYVFVQLAGVGPAAHFMVASRQ